MPRLDVRAVEKWTGNPVQNARIFLNDVRVMAGEDQLATNESGVATLDLTTGVAKLCASAEGYETACQTLNVVANTATTIIMTPVARAL